MQSGYQGWIGCIIRLNIIAIGTICRSRCTNKPLTAQSGYVCTCAHACLEICEPAGMLDLFLLLAIWESRSTCSSSLSSPEGTCLWLPRFDGQNDMEGHKSLLFQFGGDRNPILDFFAFASDLEELKHMPFQLVLAGGHLLIFADSLWTKRYGRAQKLALPVWAWRKMHTAIGSMCNRGSGVCVCVCRPTICFCCS